MYHPRYKCPVCGRKYDAPITACVCERRDLEKLMREIPRKAKPKR